MKKSFLYIILLSLSTACNTPNSPTDVAVAAQAATTAPTQSAPAPEIEILCGVALKPAMIELIPQFEQSSGFKVTTNYGVVGDITDRVQKGEAADLVIVTGEQIDALEKEGKVSLGSRVDLAKVGVGVFTAKGAPKPDISSVETFKQSMLAAKSIGYIDPAAGEPISGYIDGVLAKLGIAAEMKPKTRLFKERPVAFNAVANGDVEFGFNQISVILDAPNVGLPSVDLVGPLPVAIQYYTAFAAGILASSKQASMSKAFIRFISSPAAVTVLNRKGFE